jgi:hypothetical protein
LKIPIFVSRPSNLNKEQEKAKDIIFGIVEEFGLEPRSLGSTDYPSDCPLKEVLLIARHCHGGIILGFEQFSTNSGVWKKGTEKENKQLNPVSFPTPWNQLEAGILFGLRLPLMVFKEETITGGVFDPGVTDVFIHKMPIGKVTSDSKNSLRESILNWQRKVRTHYYDE